MSTKSAELYRELALLAESRVPLPEGLRELAAGLRGASAQVLDRLAGDIEQGKPLSDAMAATGSFDRFTIDLIRRGENHDMLPHALRDAAAIAKDRDVLMSRLRETLMYPVAALILCVLITACLLRFVIPHFTGIFEEMGLFQSMISWRDEQSGLPSLTRALFALSELVVTAWPVIVVLLALLVLAGFVFVFGGKASFAMLQLACRWLPMVGRLQHVADHARCTRLLALFLKAGLPLREALESASAFVEGKKLQTALRTAATRIADGEETVGVLRGQRRIDNAVALTFAHAPEPELPAALLDLSALFSDRVDGVRSRIVSMTQLLAQLFLAVVIGIVVITMFRPLADILRML